MTIKLTFSHDVIAPSIAITRILSFLRIRSTTSAYVFQQLMHLMSNATSPKRRRVCISEELNLQYENAQATITPVHETFASRLPPVLDPSDTVAERSLGILAPARSFQRSWMRLEKTRRYLESPSPHPYPLATLKSLTRKSSIALRTGLRNAPCDSRNVWVAPRRLSRVDKRCRCPLAKSRDHQ